MKRFFSVVGVTSSATPDQGQAASKKPAKEAPVPEPAGSEGAGGQKHPLTFLSWNVNGLLPRLKKDLSDVLALIERESPDIIALQEVRLPARKDGSRRNRARMDKGNSKDERSDFALIESTIMKWDYCVALSLSDKRYAGVALLVKRSLQKHVQSVTFNLPGASEAHHPDGRIIIAEFDSFAVMCTYVPNHGWTDASFQRREEWDAAMLSYLRARTKPLVWLGDCNVSHTDIDVTHPAYFRNQKSDRDPLPGDPDYRGQPGFAPIEQRRFGDMLREGRLIDAYRHLHKEGGSDDFTWRGGAGQEGGWAKYFGKGMRIDYTLVSQALMAPQGPYRIARAAILGRGIDRVGFCGSDHCPILLKLEELAGDDDSGDTKVAEAKVN